MIFEDLHWVDPDELGGSWSDDGPDKNLGVLLIVYVSTGVQPPWIGRPYVSALTLNRLDEREIAAMIDRIVGNKPLPTTSGRTLLNALMAFRCLLRK